MIGNLASVFLYCGDYLGNTELMSIYFVVYLFDRGKTPSEYKIMDQTEKSCMFYCLVLDGQRPVIWQQTKGIEVVPRT